MVIQMNNKDKRIIEKYQQDEKAMILAFAQWCINHNLDPMKVYQRAYPQQKENKALLEAMELTVPKEEGEVISTEMVLQILQLFGNNDLAFIVQEEADKARL
jgi:hypothetical protein